MAEVMSVVENGHVPMDLDAPDLFFAGALIYKEKKGKHGSSCVRPDGHPGDCLIPTWRYRIEPFMRAIEESGLSLELVGIRCGWENGYTSRILGLRGRSATRRKDGRLYAASVATSLSYRNAAKIANALDLDLVEWEI